MKKILKIAAIAIGALVALIVIVAVATSSGHSSPTAAKSRSPQQPAITAPPASASPAPPPAPPQPATTTLLTMSGSGIENSAPFTVNVNDTVTANYSYDCSANDGTGNFIADMEAGNQASLSSDDQSVANALGSGGSASTTLYPTGDGGSMYYLSVNSECSWTVTLVQNNDVPNSGG